MITGHLPELVIILVLGLVFFGPKRLPELGEAMGKGIHSFKKGISDMDTDSKSDEPSPSADISALPAASSVFVVDDVARDETAEEIHATRVR